MRDREWVQSSAGLLHIPLVTSFVRGASNGQNAFEVSQCSLCILAASFHDISQTQSFQQNRHVLFPAFVALKLLVSLISRLVACSPRFRPDTQTDGQTDRRTDRQNDYCNPRCACAPRVNNTLPRHHTPFSTLSAHYAFNKPLAYIVTQCL